MVMVKDMPKKKSPDEPSEQNQKEGKKKKNTGVKLHPEYKRRLKVIAAELGINMGQLVQREMEEFMAREWKARKNEEWNLDWQQLTPR